MENKLPKRKKNRLLNYDYSSSGVYFVTICTKEKKCLFWSQEQPDFVGEDIILPPDHVQLSPYGKYVDEAIQAIPKHYPHIELLQYVIMPNHVHLIAFISDADGRMISSPTKMVSLSIVIGQLKRSVSKKIGKPIWQRSFHDHIIRNHKDYEKIAKYIYENPIKWQDDCFYSKS